MLLVNQKIKKIREENKMTQEQFAEMLNMSQQSYSKLERGETQINMPKLMEIAQVLNLPVESLMHQDAKSILANFPLLGQSVSHSFSSTTPTELTILYQSHIAVLKLIIDYQGNLIEQLQK